MLSAQTNIPQSLTESSSTPLAAAASQPLASWLEVLWSLPVFNWFAPQPVQPSTWSAQAPPAPPLPPCSIAPLPPVTDSLADRFNTTQSLDTADLTTGMSRALARFQRIVNSLGGSLELKSAYRPPAYQLHLQQVWDKWMQVRNDQDPSCHDLRAEVQQEFGRHHLIESQRPVTSSDHTRGLAFDATVVLPPNARIKRRKATLDQIARLAGLRRPDIVHDPVHYKYVSAGATTAAVRRRHPAHG